MVVSLFLVDVGTFISFLGDGGSSLSCHFLYGNFLMKLFRERARQGHGGFLVDGKIFFSFFWELVACHCHSPRWWTLMLFSGSI